MKITMTWGKFPDDSVPTLISAYDEWTADGWGGVPDFHQELVITAQDDGADTRDCAIEIPDGFVERLFAIPTVTAVVSDAV